MAARHADFVKAAQEGQAARLACRTLRRKAGAARQAIAQLLELTHAQNLPTHLLEELYEAAQQIGSNLKCIGDPNRLTDIVGKLEALRAQASDWVERSVESVNMSGSGDSCVGSILLTNRNQGTYQVYCNGSGREGALPSPPPKQAPEPISDKLDLTPTELIRLAPRLESCLLTDRPSWNDLAAAAAVLSHHLGIPRSLYGEACRTLGRIPAAVAIAIVSTKRPDYFHTSGPGGYLRGMLRRAERGQLFLDRSVFGLRDAAGYRRKSHDESRGNWRRGHSSRVATPFRGPS